MPMKKKKAPSGLSPEASAFFRELQGEYEIQDATGVMYMRRSCEALDRLRDAQRQIKRDGAVISDKKGSVKQHPAISIEKEAHRQMMEALKALNLDIEPLKAVGRPPRS